MKIKKGDNVIVITGKDKGKSGVVEIALPKKDMVVVSGVNLKKKHQRTRSKGAKGQIIEKQMPIHVSNVKLADKAAKKAPKVAKVSKAKK